MHRSRGRAQWPEASRALRRSDCGLVAGLLCAERSRPPTAVRMPAPRVGTGAGTPPVTYARGVPPTRILASLAAAFVVLGGALTGQGVGQTLLVAVTVGVVAALL